MRTAAVGAAALGLADDFAKAAIDGRDMLDDLDNANFGDLARVDQQLASGVAHALSADAEEVDRLRPAELCRRSAWISSAP